MTTDPAVTAAAEALSPRMYGDRRRLNAAAEAAVAAARPIIEAESTDRWYDALLAESDACRGQGNIFGALAIHAAAHAVRNRIARGQA